MKNRKSFLKGALCGALAMLLVAGLVSCGLKVNNGNSDITSKTEDKILPCSVAFVADKVCYKYLFCYFGDVLGCTVYNRS